MTEPPTVRLFVAVHPPEEALAELAAALEPVRGTAPAGLRWAPPAQWHLTLAFLGEVPVEAVPALEAELAHVARRHGPARLRIAGAGRFGDRVLWAGLADGDGGPGGRPGPGVLVLRDLAGATVRRVAKAGIATGARFKAHLTLARARDGADLRPLVDALRGFAGSPWTADELCLVRSRLGAGPDRGSAYETLRAWPLGGAAGDGAAEG